MKRTGKYAALDVHQTTTTASVREEGGRVIARAVLPTEDGAIVEFFGGERGRIQVAFEEGTQAEWVAKLQDRGVRYRAEALYTELDVLWELRPNVNAAMVAEARRDPARPVLLSIPYRPRAPTTCWWTGNSGHGTARPTEGARSCMSARAPASWRRALSDGRNGRRRKR